ncbi:agmatinase family protein [Paenibacillus ehimensis]|uniref:Agmatinase family protein n=1 Tax=Paenibacillus ehimensis TaxID=79264 RepID=A0ABT8VK73_9BACL|nr:agmatinase family protein [Paenibacillus ehimensis]MDO3681385.1 agmatinase family protein [Paenibacillus ehimensis]MEC0213545.1 agmatinase family protein [Paenibacillus ehimensis]
MHKFTHLQRPGVMFTPGAGDPYVTRLCDWITEWDGQQPLDAAIVGAPLSKSSISFSGAHLHPATLRQLFSAFTTYNFEADLDLSSLRVGDLGDVGMHVTDIPQCHRNIEQAFQEITQQLPSTIPCLVGGDHSITFPALTGIQGVRKERIGLIQFDAHLDVRDTAYGGRSNGTPIRSLVENDVIRGEDIVNIGLRSFANSKAYRDFAEQQGITLYTARQVREEGIKPILERTIRELAAKTDSVYVTFDIDVLDQADVPGVPAIGPGGLSPVDLFTCAELLGEWNRVIGMDMVCVDPSRDTRDRTSRISLHVLLYFLTGLARRRLALA